MSRKSVTPKKQKQPFVDNLFLKYISSTSSTLPASEHSYRMKIVQGCMHSGIPIEKLDKFGDTLMEFTKFRRLPRATNLRKTYIPIILHIQFATYQRSTSSCNL